MRVSVVVPARNEELRIGRCVRALLAQDYPREQYEVIVVDDGSQDRTADVAAGFGVAVLRQPPSGGAAARNLGVAHARGEVVAFTDADCVPVRDWLRELVAPFQDPSVAASGGDVVGEPVSWIARYIEAAGYFRLERRWHAHPWPIFVTANVAYRKAVFEALGGFDPELRGASDLEMTWRVARDGRFRLVPRPQALVWHAHPTSVRALYEQWRGYGAGGPPLIARLWGPRAVAADAWRQVARAGLSLALAVPRLLGRAARRRRGEEAAYPLLDVVRSVAYAAGYWSAWRGRPPDEAWRDRVAASCGPVGPGNSDGWR